MWRCNEGHESKTYKCLACRALQQQINAAIKNPLPQHLRDEYDDERPLEWTSAGCGVSVQWRCSKGHTWKSPPSQRKRGFGCPECFNANRGEKRHLAAVKSNPMPESFRKNYCESNTVPFDSLAAGSDRVAKWRCDEGHQWDAEIRTISSGHWCPKCFASKKTSGPETEIYEYLKSAHIDAIQSDRTAIFPKELDIYIPSKNIAVEYNGLYWHTEGRVGKNYHKEKRDACLSKGIQLIHVWEDDWNRNKELVLKMLGDKVAGRKTVGARKTSVKDLAKRESDVFLSKHHIQGPASGTNYTGLIYNDELVAVMVTKVTKGVASLERYASSTGVFGGMDKMMKHLGYKNWVTFADHTVSNGNLYESTGWTKDKELPPDYKYVVNGVREHKFNYRLSRFKSDPNLLFEEGLTERQLAHLNGMERIYDAGKTRYTKTLM